MTKRNRETWLSREEAKRQCVLGWNIRCNKCGSYGAVWIKSGRPGWGSLALCPIHEQLYLAEMKRHSEELLWLAKIEFEQELDR